MRIFKNIQKIEIYKFGIISPVLHGSAEHQNEYFEKLANMGVAIPPGSEKVYYLKPTTFKSWLRKYRQNGLKGLVEKGRSDKDKLRKINPDLPGFIQKIRDEWHLKSIKSLWRKLIECGHLKEGDLSYECFRRYLKKNPLLFAKEPIPRKKFEKAQINELWMVDFKHGRSISHGKGHRQVHLCAIIDDATRMVVGYEWDFHEGTALFSRALFKAVSVFGIPKILYADNGKVFISHYAMEVCARLGTSLVNTAPYSPESKGKIERFNRTVQQLFYPMVKDFRVLKLEELNRLFDHFINDCYHQWEHGGLGESPLAKFHRLLTQTNIERMTDEKLKSVFQCSLSRRVRNDATVRIDNLYYEVDVKYIGQKIEIRFPLDRPNDFYIYDNDQMIRKILPVNLVENANHPYNENFYSKIAPQGEK